MSSVVISGDTSGSVTLAAPAVAGSTTLTLPAATGTVMVSGNMPAFSATTTTAQSFSNNTFTKAQLNIETFDTNSNYDNATNYRFTPTVAGYYQINGNIAFSGSASGFVQVGIYKNGGIFIQGSMGSNNTAVGGQANASAVIYFNGSTDYVEFYAWQGSGGALALNPGTGQNTFSGAMIRSA
jgi:hypothetical protein